MIYFASVLLKNAEEPAEEIAIVSSSTRLLSGNKKIQVSPVTDQKFTFTCHTSDAADIASLISLIGTVGTLDIDGVEYENFFITSFSKTWEYDNHWTYSITLEKDTSL